MNVAQTILNQLGGNKFLAMTRAIPIISDEKSITFKLNKNISKANELKITLNQKDLYNMKFLIHKYPKVNYKTWEFTEDKKTTIKILNDVFCEQLKDLFTKTTGMYTSL